MQSGRHSFYCTLELSCPHDNLSAIPPATKVAGFLASFYEGQTYVFVAQNTPKRIPENRAFIILDSRVRNEPIFDLRFKRYEKAKAPIYKADTIVELARQCGLPEAMLAKTVKEFNEAVHAGKGSKINKKAEVLNRDGKAIPGLHAAGDAIGVLFYDNYLDGSQLTAAVIRGRVAA